MGSPPYHLYQSIAYDGLHVMALGPLRQLPDLAFRAFGNEALYRGHSKSELVQIANQRVMDMPRSSRLARLAPFRSGQAEKQPGMSGFLRRELSPFLWFALMGLSSLLQPDDDPLVTSALLLDAIYRDCAGINKSPAEAQRTETQIEHLQAVCFVAGKSVAEALSVNINTKLHRIMRHVKDHIFNFGCLRKGATDLNEQMHKFTKRAYNSSNRHLKNIAPQLLSARAELEAQEAEFLSASFVSPGSAQLLLTRQPILKKERDTVEGEGEHESTASLHPSFSSQLQSLLSEVESLIDGSSSVEDAQRAVIEAKGECSHRRVWCHVKEARFECRFPWWEASRDGYQIYQVVYAGEVVFNVKNRRDSVESRHRQNIYIGVIQALFRQVSGSEHLISLMRRLKKANSEKGNENVVTQFKHNRFEYEMTASGEVVIDAVPVSSFNRAVMLVPDPYFVTKRYGFRQRLSEIPDTKEERKHSKFFEVTSYKYTSIPERNC